MSDKYKIFEGEDPYFVTFTVVDWIKVLNNYDFRIDTFNFDIVLREQNRN